MADIESVVRVHLMLLRGVGAGVESRVTNDWLSNRIAGQEVGAPDGETSIARVVRRFAGLRDAGFVGVPSSLGNLERLLVHGSSKDGKPRNFSTHIDVAMKNVVGPNNVAVHGNVVRGMFNLVGVPWGGNEDFKDYAEVFRAYIDISNEGINFLKQKRQHLKTMGVAFDDYIRRSTRLKGLEIELILKKVTQAQAENIMTEVYDSFDNWLSKARLYFKYKAVDTSLQGTQVILGDMELVDRANIGFDEIMTAKDKADDEWDHDDFLLLLQYTDVDIEGNDVGLVAAQEILNIETSRNIYDRFARETVHPPAVVLPDRVAEGREGREERRAERDTERRSNAAIVAFRRFWNRSTEMGIEEVECIGTLKALEKDLENVMYKCDRYTEEAGEEMGNLMIDGYDISIASQ